MCAVLKILFVVNIHDAGSLLYITESAIHNIRSSLQIAARPYVARLLVSRLLCNTWELPVVSPSTSTYSLSYGQVAETAVELLQEIETLAKSVSNQSVYFCIAHSVSRGKLV